MMLKQSLWILGFCFFGSVYCTYDASNPTPVYVVHGGEADLQCGFESEKLNWHYVHNGVRHIIADGGDVTDSSIYSVSKNSLTGNYYRLHILNVGVLDVKKYNCEGNVNGMTKNFYLQLVPIVPPSSLSIKNVTPADRILGTEGQDLTVSCTAVGGKPAPNVVLIIDGQSAANKTQTAQHTLTTIRRSFDRKTVTCQASHGDYSQDPISDSAIIYLNLRPFPPTITGYVGSIEETKPLVVSCTTTGSRPNATLQWTIGQKDVTSDATERSSHITASDTHTVISDLTYSVGKNDNGQMLACKAINVAAPSGVQTSITVNVTYAPTVSVSNVTYDQNEATRTLTCNPDGNPQSYTYYKWQHKSRYGVLIRELDGQKNVLTLPNKTVEDRYQDSGEYVCTAGNGIVGKDRNVKQTGSGYVTINAQPIFTNDNKLTQYGEFGGNVDVNVYLYSIPKYTTLRWYRGNTPVSTSTRYVMSDPPAIVNDTFHGKDVQLDGYSVMLTIKSLKESDFNVSYRLELSYGASQTVQYTVLLESASPPQTPTNFTLVSSTDTSIVVEWIPGYNGGHEQTFRIQYRIINESKMWITQEIPQYNKQTYILSDLQGDTWYELRMFAENKFDKSSVTDIQSISTVPSVKKESQTGAIIGGVAGGLIGVILLLLLLAAVFYFRAKQDKNKPSKRNSSAVEDGLKQNILYDSSVTEGMQKNVLYQSAGTDYKPLAPNAEYAEVQRPNAVYAQVDPKTQQKNLKAKKQKDKKEKPKKGSKPKGKALNNNAFAEYSNADLPLKSINDGEYANAEDTCGPSNSNKTTQGLEYADLSFVKKIPRKGQKPKIHGADERTIYSDVDHTKRAPPLPQENPYEETNIGQGQK